MEKVSGGDMSRRTFLKVVGGGIICRMNFLLPGKYRMGLALYQYPPFATG
jgi:hypothetical protein